MENKRERVLAYTLATGIDNDELVSLRDGVNASSVRTGDSQFKKLLCTKGKNGQALNLAIKNRELQLFYVL